MTALPDRCPLCGSAKKKGETTITVDLGFGVVVVRDVPATVCSQCGADCIEDAIAGKVEEIVDEARKRHHLVEVTTLLAN
ncbi:MAG: type II toxin-antitoxin system MqsA family antitoxin [Deltaproteobacteria bacterium]|nr:type II toxin-antitoxin system MqsA family antitoxin [Deltaproteobacteria bacterium]